jgi:hypothetical protein
LELIFTSRGAQESVDTQADPIRWLGLVSSFLLTFASAYVRACVRGSVSRKATRPRKGGSKDKQRKRDVEKKHDANKPATLPRCS